MARYNTNRYQYETSPRKVQPEFEPRKKQYPKKSTSRKNATKVDYNKRKNIEVHSKSSKNFKIVLYIGIVFALLFAVSYRNALITQKYSEIKKLKTELSELEKDNKQLEVNIETKTNLGLIEEKGTNELGLKKLDDSQTVYVSLDKQDYIESSSEDVKLTDESNWVSEIINKLKNIF